MKLYSYWRSSCSYRVRIALALKGLEADIVPVNLLKGDNRSEAYRAINPSMRVPSLQVGDKILTQSLAIIEYLDECFVQHLLLPTAPEERVNVRQLSLSIAADIAPVNNLSQLRYLTGELGANEEQKMTWYRHWIAEGFTAFETMLTSSEYTAQFCHGPTPTMADCCLIPQVYNARRFDCDLSDYPTIVRIDEACNQLPAFITAHPDNQPDAQ